MTRRKWTTSAQGEWLQGHLEAFMAAQTTKKTTTEFFPQILKEWHQAWPVPDATPEEISKAKNAEDAMKKKRNDCDNVRQYVLPILLPEGLTSCAAHQGLVSQPYSRSSIWIRNSWPSEAQTGETKGRPGMASLSTNDL